MSKEVWETIAVVASVIIARLWSMLEHRKTGKAISDIRIFINGEMLEKLERAKQEGRDEVKNEGK